MFDPGGYSIKCELTTCPSRTNFPVLRLSTILILRDLAQLVNLQMADNKQFI